MCGHDFAWLAGRASPYAGMLLVTALGAAPLRSGRKSFTNLLTIVHELAECGVFIALSKFMNE